MGAGVFCNQGSPHWDIGNPAKGDPNRSTDESSFVPKFIYFISSFTITISQHKNLHKDISFTESSRESESSVTRIDDMMLMVKTVVLTDSC